MAPPSSFAKLWQGFTSLPGPKKITLVVTALLTLASLMTFVYLSNQEEYRVLFSNLSNEDAAGIVNKLKEKKVPYQLSPAGDAISVPTGAVSELRLELAAAGLPQGGGVGFEIFNNRALGATEFEQQLNYRRALQGELSRTINSLDEIQQSRVHIALPKESLFVEQQKKVTASVTLKLKQGRKLKQSQIDGIAHLVASSVEGLSPDDVIVVDSQGTILSQNGSDSRLAHLSSSQIEYQRNIEKETANQIQTMLEKVVGQGKAVVRVNAELDFRVTEKTEETYDPESPVVRSSQKLTDRATGPSPSAGKDASAAGTEKEKSDETLNYEINKTVSKTVMPVGDVKKLSIAVLVDGVYQKSDKGAATYQERPKKELDSIEDLVRKSAGFNTQRGDQVTVASMPFNRDDTDQGLVDPTWQDRLLPFFPVFKYLMLILALLMVFLFVVRPLIANLTRSGQRLESVRSQPLADASGVSVELSGNAPPLAIPQLDDKLQTEVELAKQLAGVNSKKYAELLRNWLK